jgi:putative heme-binding domain-containing protein
MTARLLLVLLSLLGHNHAADTHLVRATEALSPEEEQTRLTVPDGFEIQLFASEPMINKPINLAFDSRGRLWVSSTAEYPYSADRSRWSDAQGTRVQDSRDSIKILEDSDGDGRADKVTVFADGLNIPTGVLPWHKPEHKAGCIAWSIPNLWYFADTDGDDRADVREVLFGPLGYENDTHGMCSSFRLGLDGWIYATHGFNNTSTFHVRQATHQNPAVSSNAEPVVLHGGNVFRFQPDGSAVEVWTRGQVNPFGLAWDRYGRLYSADCHSSPVYQLIRGAHYPSFGKPHDGLGFAPVMCEHTHGSTGICGIVYLDGGVWGVDWDDQVLVGNVVTSRVNRDRVTFVGSSPKAREQPDFIRSTDPWFRPVDLQLGPDHALYIADFYNRIIGHYEVPLDHPGRDRHRGRIWRVVKKGTPKPDSVDFTRMSPRTIAKELGNPNLTRRHLALQEVRRRGHPSWLTELGQVFNDDSPFPPFRPVGDARPEGYADSEPHDFQTLPLQWRKTDLQLAHTLWALSHLGERFAVASVLRHLHSGGWWVTDKGDQLSGLLMAHATQIVGSQKTLHPWERWALGIIFDFRGSAAIRAATQVLQNQPDFFSQTPDREPDAIDEWRLWIVERLIELCDRMVDPPADEPHLQGDSHSVHAMKVLLRDWLAQPWFRHDGSLMTGLKPITSKPWFQSVMQAVPTEEAAAFLLASLTVESPPERWTHIARHHRPGTLPAVIAIARRPEGRPLERLQALIEGLGERGLDLPAELLAWAQELAETRLAETAQSPNWIRVPQAGPAPAWSLQPRPCADGTEAPVLQSMNQGGGDEESRTGSLQSPTFPAPARLNLWINGHRGLPGRPPHDKNFVRIVAAEDGRELVRAYPPRSDTAQHTELDLSGHAGQSVRLEIVDGDAGKAYAWLGITRLKPVVVALADFGREAEHRAELEWLALQLRRHAPVSLRDRLAAYLPPQPAPPQAVSPEQRRQLDALIHARTTAFAAKQPDATGGAQVFQTHCAACHQIGGLGGLLGPQLDGIGTRGVARLCEDILDPNRNVDAHFYLHQLSLRDGSSLSGFLKAEAGQMIILADATGRETRVPKSEITKAETHPLSLMPPAFAQTIPEPDFLTLLAWLLER